MNAITAITRTTRIAHPTIIRMMLNFSSGIRESMELNLPPSRKQFTIGGGGEVNISNNASERFEERPRGTIQGRNHEGYGEEEGKRRSGRR